MSLNPSETAVVLIEYQNDFTSGSWGADIDKDLTPAEGDILVEGKRGLDAFASTNLDFILRSRGIKNVVLGGFLTNCCVESTMRSAYERGFNAFTSPTASRRPLSRSTTTRARRTTRCSPTR